MYKIGKYSEKRQVIACDNHTQQTVRIDPDHSFLFIRSGIYKGLI